MNCVKSRAIDFHSPVVPCNACQPSRRYPTGVAGGLAALHDLLDAAAAPLTLAAAATSLLLRRHLAGLRATWRMVRGTYRQSHHVRQGRGQGQGPGKVQVQEQGQGQGQGQVHRQQQEHKQQGMPFEGSQAIDRRLPARAAGAAAGASVPTPFATAFRERPTSSTRARLGATAATGHMTQATSLPREESHAPYARPVTPGTRPEAAAAVHGPVPAKPIATRGPSLPPGTPSGRGKSAPTTRGSPPAQSCTPAPTRGPAAATRGSLPASPLLAQRLSALGSRIPLSRLESLLGLAPEPKVRVTTSLVSPVSGFNQPALRAR